MSGEDMDAFRADLDARLARIMQEDDGMPPPEEPSRPTRSSATSRRPASTRRAPPQPAAVSRSGRREKTILLGMLGTLAGAFVGVLSMKLLVPRPPEGAGPDVHVDAAGSDGIDLVEPPALTVAPQPPESQPDPFRAAGGVVAASFAEPDPRDAGRISRSRFSAAPEMPEAGAAARSRFGGEPTEGLAAAAPPELSRVPEFDGRGMDEPAAQPAVPAANPFRRGAAAAPPVADAFPPHVAPPGDAPPPRSLGLDPSPAAVATPVAGFAVPRGDGAHVVRDGDTWWSIAEAAYGDGRMYKALFAWNRAIDPRTSLAPGTQLEVPDEARLRSAWGRLVPDQASAPR